MNTSLESKIDLLKDRAQMLREARAFFFARAVLEVDCPALSHASSIDEHIDVIHVELQKGEKAYLHTSPEYGMKRLLSLDIGDIFQLSHVFRHGEIGPLHNPEFTMVEWYRLGIDFDHFIEETLDFIRLFLGPLPSERVSFRALFKKHTDLDYLTATEKELATCAQEREISLPPDASSWNKDTLIQLLMSFLVEPHLGQGLLTVLSDFPASQAALAQTKMRGNEPIAERFEVYFKGMELTNGYHELTDAAEQRRRLHLANRARKAQGKESLPIDEHFLSALETGLPDCCGVAVGFDRLMMLRHQTPHIADILPIPWHLA